MNYCDFLSIFLQIFENNPTSGGLCPRTPYEADLLTCFPEAKSCYATSREKIRYFIENSAAKISQEKFRTQVAHFLTSAFCGEPNNGISLCLSAKAHVRFANLWGGYSAWNIPISRVIFHAIQNNVTHGVLNFSYLNLTYNFPLIGQFVRDRTGSHFPKLRILCWIYCFIMNLTCCKYFDFHNSHHKWSNYIL